MYAFNGTLKEKYFNLMSSGVGSSDKLSANVNYVETQTDAEDQNKYYYSTYPKFGCNVVTDLKSYIYGTDKVLSIGAKMRVPAKTFNNERSIQIPLGSYIYTITYGSGAFTSSVSGGNYVTKKWEIKSRPYIENEWINLELRCSYADDGKLQIGIFADNVQFAYYESSTNTYKNELKLGKWWLISGSGTAGTDDFATHWDDMIIKATNALDAPSPVKPEGDYVIGSYNGTFTAYPIGESINEMTGTLVVAVFKQNNTVEKIYQGSADTGAEEDSDTGAKSIKVSIAETGKYKAFLFDSLTNAVPMCPMIEGTN